MAKYRAIKNQKHSLRKARNRVRRLGDSWYSKEYLFKLRSIGVKEIKEQMNDRVNSDNKTW